MISLIIAVLVVLLSSALCSGAEASLFSISMVKVQQLASTKTKSALALLSIRNDMNRPIATIVVLNNIANIVGSVVVGGIATTVLGSQWLGVFSGALTFLVIIFSEIIPKTLGEQHAESISLKVALPIIFLSKLLTPLLWCIERITIPLTGKNSEGFKTNESEIKLLASIGGEEGFIEAKESDIIKRAFELNNTTAKMLMTPRVTMTYIHFNSSLEEVKEEVIESEHSRIVVTGDSIDDLKGIVLKQDLLIALVQNKGNKQVNEFVKPAQLIEETTTAEELLNLFQESHKHLGVVTDEYGGISGVVTLEDVLEILTGEIVDETDKTVDLQVRAKENKKTI